MRRKTRVHPTSLHRPFILQCSDSRGLVPADDVIGCWSDSDGNGGGGWRSTFVDEDPSSSALLKDGSSTSNALDDRSAGCSGVLLDVRENALLRLDRVVGMPHAVVVVGSRAGARSRGNGVDHRDG